jgi:secretion/DNA translocation related TadE-like protein
VSRQPVRGAGKDERGSAAVFGIAALGLLTAFAMTCGGIAGIVVTHRQAQAAADLGSLAAATAIQHGRPPCAAASEVSRRNGGRLVGCSVRGEVVTVRVEASTPPLLGLVRHTRASARAGPVWSGSGLVPR